MKRDISHAFQVAGLLLLGAASAYAHEEHGHGGHNDAGHGSHSAPSPDSSMDHHASPPKIEVVGDVMPTYFRHEDYHYLLIAHIVLMTLSWVFVLPASVMLTIAKSNLRLPVQFGFLVLNAVGVFLSIIYSAYTPDLYPGNAHHSIGWVVTWIVGVQMMLALLNAFINSGGKGGQPDDSAEYAPLTRDDLDEQRWKEEEAYRYSTDGGRTQNGAESESMRSSTSTSVERHDAHHDIPLHYDAAPSTPRYPAGSWRGKLETAISTLSNRSVRILSFTESAINRSMLFLGYVAFLTGIVTWGGFFQGQEIFSGLAHWIKGSVFFWYGILTLSRWAGSFANRGWAWNLVPQKTGKKAPYSAEFVESFLIFFYGSTNVFLEHLAAWGKAWSHTDLEHLAITILFIGGGLCGMLVESTKIRNLLNYTATPKPEQQTYKLQAFGSSSTLQNTDSEAQEDDVPATYKFSLNPLPALTIALLGMLMSSHHQNSVVSTMIHAQWGMLLFIAALSRFLTYIIFFLKPPTSTLPARPPTELIAAFCLIAGGTMFCVSAHDTVTALEMNGLDAMFAFTVTMGVVAGLMAWELVVLCLKGWAVRRQSRSEV